MFEQAFKLTWLLSWQRVHCGGRGANPSSWRCVYQWLQNWVIFRSRICKVLWKIPVCPEALDCFKGKTGLSVHAQFCLIFSFFFSLPKRHCLPSVVLVRLSMIAEIRSSWWMKFKIGSSNSLWCSEANFLKMLYMFQCIQDSVRYDKGRFNFKWNKRLILI